VEDPTRWLPAEQGPVAFLVLFASSVIEYVFPPFPGDAITVLGAFLVTARNWSGPAVFACTTLGSLVGAAIDWSIGVRAKGLRERRGAVDRLVARFERHGPAFIVVNRFVPGVRALFFVAAGMAGMRAGPVLGYAALSAILWNALLFGAGVMVGSSWDRLFALFIAYNRVAWVVLGVLALAGVGLWARQRLGSR
jgi:membrane protein DedA with SNARE-associated domain